MTKPIETIVSIPPEVLASVDLLLWDPLRNKIRYGARSALIVSLLRTWLRDRETAPDPAPTPTPTPFEETD